MGPQFSHLYNEVKHHLPHKSPGRIDGKKLPDNTLITRVLSRCDGSLLKY